MPIHFRVLMAAIALAASVRAQDGALDNLLFASQIGLGSAATGLTVARVARAHADGRALGRGNTGASLGLTGTTLAIERIEHRHLSKKAKIWLIIGNVAVTTLLTVAAHNDVKAGRPAGPNNPVD